MIPTSPANLIHRKNRRVCVRACVKVMERRARAKQTKQTAEEIKDELCAQWACAQSCSETGPMQNKETKAETGVRKTEDAREETRDMILHDGQEKKNKQGQKKGVGTAKRVHACKRRHGCACRSGGKHTHTVTQARTGILQNKKYKKQQQKKDQGQVHA